MIKQVFQGYHGTIFAYGQTGSGKTYTMEGYKYTQNEKGVFTPLIEEAQKEDSLGLIQRCSKDVCDLLNDPQLKTYFI